MLTTVTYLCCYVVGDAERLKLLGVPVYKKQTNEACGVTIARLTCKLLQDWCCADQVVNMAFDTTASNAGHLTVACIAIQLSLGRLLLWSGCRHIGEVLLNQVFTDLKVESSRSPEVTLFTRQREMEPVTTRIQQPMVLLHFWQHRATTPGQFTC